MANPFLPFGGVGESGYGVYHGKYSFEAFSHMRSVLHKNLVSDPAIKFPPYDEKKEKIIAALLAGNIGGLFKVLLGLE